MHETHANHSHQHGGGCGHTALRHDGHVDYIHDGDLHNVHESHVDEHRFGNGRDNPPSARQGTRVRARPGHRHGQACGHEAAPHDDHSDYLVAGHLHHAHGTHCDDHGRVGLA